MQGFATPMSGEGFPYNPTLVQSLITSYYVVREPPQLVQQRITHYFPVYDGVDEESQSVDQAFTAPSCYSLDDDVSSSSHISGTPTSRLQDIAWYVHSGNQAVHARECLVRNSKTLFKSELTEDALSPEELTAYPSPTPSSTRLVSFIFFIIQFLSFKVLAPVWNRSYCCCRQHVPHVDKCFCS